MFTGIVEDIGVVERVEDRGDAVRLTVRSAAQDQAGVLEGLAAGESIAVDGCCLTVATLGDHAFTADVMAESLKRTTLGELTEGSPVNLERAVTATTRLGGHLVQGHVDATGTIRGRSPSEHWEVVEVTLPPALGRYVVEKGSITVDGISLTVVAAVSRSFTVSLIPETLRRTTLGGKQPGSRVNLEVDVIAKYVERLLGGSALGRAAGNGLGWPAQERP